MPDRAKYDLSYRPVSYWTTPSDGVALGESAPTVSWISTRRTPFLDPMQDFLPEHQPGEVEIACIALASVMGDVISIRARRWGRRIVYRIVDEYGTRFRFRRRHSTQPLSMGGLIALIDGATGHLDGAMGLTSAYRDYNLVGCDADELVDFVTVTSEYYPELYAYYGEEAVEWVASVGRGAESGDNP